MEWLKKFLPEALYTQVEEALKDKDVKPVNLASGEYVSATKYNDEIKSFKNEVQTLKTQLTEANKQIEAFKEMDVDGIKAAADEWKAKAEQAEKDATARIAEMEHDSLLRESLSGLKFTSEYAKKGVFDEIKGKGLKVENGKILGLDDAISEIRGAKADAFVTEDDDKAPAFSKHSGGSSPSSDQDIRAIMGLKTET